MDMKFSYITQRQFQVQGAGGMGKPMQVSIALPGECIRGHVVANLMEGCLNKLEAFTSASKQLSFVSKSSHFIHTADRPGWLVYRICYSNKPTTWRTALPWDVFMLEDRQAILDGLK